MSAITPNAPERHRTKQRLFNTFNDWMSKQIHERTKILAIINGVLGDYLAASQHPLAIPMHLRMNGQPLQMDQSFLPPSCFNKNGKIMVLVHGLCMVEVPWTEQLQQQHQREEETVDPYSLMGYTPVCLRYNSGCHVSTNGQEFTRLLEALVKNWPVPVEELVIVGFSMGGLVSRSACHYGALAGHHWLQSLSKMIFIATPHHGSPLERGGNWIDRILSTNSLTAPLAKLGKIRSAGITDLRYGNLLDSDWQGRDRFELHNDQRQPVALPNGVQCYAIAATRGKQAGDLGDRFFGDGLVPLSSALGHHNDPTRCLQIAPSQQWIAYRMSHIELLKHPDSYAQIKAWLTS